MGNMLPRRSKADPVVHLWNDINGRRAAFIRYFDRQEPRLIQIAETFDRITAEVKTFVRDKKDLLKGGAIGAGVGGVLGLLAAPFTGGASLLIAGAATAVAGGTMVVTAEVVTTLKEKGGAKELEALGREFMTAVGPLNEELKEMKAIFRQLAERCLVDRRKKITKSLQKMADTLGAVDDAVQFINDLMQLVMKLLQKISTDKEDVELTNKIIESGDQCWKTIQHLRHMKEELQGINSSLRKLC